MQEDPVTGVKPFHIPKQRVMEAYRRVKANAGAAGVDQQSLGDFEANRLSRGSCGFDGAIRSA